MTPAPRKMTFSRRVRYVFETAGAYFIYGLFWLLPLQAASNCGGWILRKLGPRMGISRTARLNISRAFPEKTDAECEDVLMGMWDNLGRVIGEYPHLHRIWQCVDFEDVKRLEMARDSGRAGIFFSAHIANWEVMPIAARKIGLDMALVYRKPSNPWVDSLLRHARKSGGSRQINKGRSGAREIVTVLKDGGSVAMLMDQKLREGMPIPFFGRDAMTAPAIAQFALKFGCAIYPVYMERLKGASFRMRVFPEMEVKDTGDREGDVRRFLVEINQVLERWIRKNPEQWLWIHKRWPDDKQQ